MSDKRGKYLLDSNVLISAHRQYYAIDICPGFWKAIKKGYEDGHIYSTERVKQELLPSGDFISNWIKAELPDDFFIKDSSAEIAAEFTPLMSWVAAQGYHSAAIADFAAKADGWIIAAAKRNNFCVVTHEVVNQSKKKVKIPNVCAQFKVPYCNTFDLLRNLSYSFR
ncbi:MAG: DUF4411 family protein [Verrucomicrobiales bacterium]